jgi:hypothetical protein
MDDGFIVAGLAKDKSSLKPNLWVLRFDKDCNLYWDARFPGVEATSIKQTSDGGFILSGLQPIEGSPKSKIYLLRIDPYGNKIWDNSYQTAYMPLKSDVIETADHGFIIVEKQFLMKVDSEGNGVWCKNYDDNIFSTVALTASGELAVGGACLDYPQGPTHFDHAYIALLSGDGQSIIWDNTEILFPSGFIGVVLTAQNKMVAGGYVELDLDKSAMMLCKFE